MKKRIMTKDEYLLKIMRMTKRIKELEASNYDGVRWYYEEYLKIFQYLITHSPEEITITTYSSKDIFNDIDNGKDVSLIKDMFDEIGYGITIGNQGCDRNFEDSTINTKKRNKSNNIKNGLINQLINYNLIKKEE